MTTIKNMAYWRAKNMNSPLLQTTNDKTEKSKRKLNTTEEDANLLMEGKKKDKDGNIVDIDYTPPKIEKYNTMTKEDWLKKKDTKEKVKK